VDEEFLEAGSRFMDEAAAGMLHDEHVGRSCRSSTSWVPRSTKTYLGGAINPIIAAHVASLRNDPPRQRLATLDLAERIEAIMNTL
jgi:hypothetical protein